MAQTPRDEVNDFRTEPSLDASQRRAGSSRSRATIRASLACVPCRTKHLKCDGGLPACVRCRLEDRSCHYAKSRRGIRDPKKRDMMREEEEASTTPSTPLLMEQHGMNTPSPEFNDFDISIPLTKPLPGGWSMVRDSKRPGSSSTTYLLDLYYTYFHDSHSWLLPKPYLVRRLQTHASDLRFIANVIAYVGSMYSTSIDSVPLRERAFAMACGPLPTTVWTVQGLMVTSIAALGENKNELAMGCLQRAAQMALDLGIHHKSFADAEPDAVLAESYRRTYWGLYTHGCLGAFRDQQRQFTLHAVPSTTELPCEEWEYQAGAIPPPISIDEYRRRLTGGLGCSSWAYLVELTYICQESVLLLLKTGHEHLPEAVDQADRRIVAWLMQLPQWKKELVDPDGAVDMILFHSIAFAHWTRIRLQVFLRGIGMDIHLSDLPTMGPIFSSPSLPSSAFHAANPWVPGPVAVQASLSLVGIFKFALPPSKLSPTCIYGLGHAALPLLDACLFGGGNSPMLQEQIMLLANVMAKSGEYWPVTKNISDDILAVLSLVRTAREPSAWDALINEIVPPHLEQQDVFLFPAPKTALEMNEWVSQREAQAVFHTDGSGIRF